MVVVGGSKGASRQTFPPPDPARRADGAEEGRGWNLYLITRAHGDVSVDFAFCTFSAVTWGVGETLDFALSFQDPAAPPKVHRLARGHRRPDKPSTEPTAPARYGARAIEVAE